MAVCIVGHGPSVREVPLGELVDTNFVIRLKNCSRLLKEPEYYGKKTDVACASTETLRSLQSVKAKEYWGYPKRGTYNALIAQHLKDATNKEVWIPQTLLNKWNDRFRELGASHNNVSLGFAAILMASERLGETIYLHGFDTLLDPWKPYYTCLKERKGHPGHDWFTENRLLEEVRDEYKLEIKRL